MKLTLTILLILTTLFATNFIVDKNKIPVESFKVIKVDGKIVYEKSGKNMVTGDLFASNEKLSFLTQESRAAVISPISGRYVLAPNPIAGAASNLLPAMSNVATRSGAINSTFDLKNHFQGDYLIMEEQLVAINIESFPLSDKTFFYFQYEIKGEKILKKLKTRGLLTPKKEVKAKWNAGDLLLKATKIQEKRTPKSRAIDAKLNNSKMFDAKTLTKKQFMLWKRNPSKYDIEGIDSKGFGKKISSSKKGKNSNNIKTNKFALHYIGVRKEGT
jgi:hypothetical protein